MTEHRVVTTWPTGTLTGDSGGIDPEIVRLARSSRYGCDHAPCPHATVKRQPAEPYESATWEVPYAILVYTQGGCDCTVMCADCIADAVAQARRLNVEAQTHGQV